MKRYWIIPAIGSAIVVPIATSEQGLVAWLKERPDPAVETRPGPLVHVAGMLGIGAAQSALEDQAGRSSARRERDWTDAAWPKDLSSFDAPGLPGRSLETPRFPAFGHPTGVMPSGGPATMPPGMPASGAVRPESPFRTGGLENLDALVGRYAEASWDNERALAMPELPPLSSRSSSAATGSGSPPDSLASAERPGHSGPGRPVQAASMTSISTAAPASAASVPSTAPWGADPATRADAFPPFRPAPSNPTATPSIQPSTQTPSLGVPGSGALDSQRPSGAAFAGPSGATVPATAPATAPVPNADPTWWDRNRGWLTGWLPELPNSTSQAKPAAEAAARPAMPTDSIAALIRFDMDEATLIRLFGRISNLTGERDLRGMRVAVTTGPAQDDLAGTLTYYLDHRRQVQRITFDGYTGDPDRLIRHVSGAYGLRPEPTLGAGLYTAQWNGQPVSVLVLEHPSVIRDDTPRTNLRVMLEVNRPGVYYGLTETMRKRLDGLSEKGTWKPGW